MDLGIAGKVAIVSGGSRGVGRSIAELLAAEGVKVVVAARSADAVDEVVKVITSAGGEALGVAADMRDEDQINAVVARTREVFGPAQIVVSNVYGPGSADFFDLTAADFAGAFDDMVLSVVRLSQAVVPDMKEAGWGRLINIGSGAGKEPPPNLKHVLANTVRAAVVALNKTLANDLGPFGITVNTIGTGFIATDRMWNYVTGVGEERGVSAEQLMAGFTAEIPLRRPGTPQEMAGIVLMLCSAFGGYVTGQLIPVDGGILRSAF